MPGSRTVARGSPMRFAVRARATPSCWPARGTSEASSSAVAGSRGTNGPPPRRRFGDSLHETENYAMTRAVEEINRRMLRSRDAMDRAHAEPLHVPALAQIANVSEAHFIRTFRATFGETPHRYLQRRRGERAMFLLRATERRVTDVCFDVGFASLGTFSRTLREVVGGTPAAHRGGGAGPARPARLAIGLVR